MIHASIPNDIAVIEREREMSKKTNGYNSRIIDTVSAPQEKLDWNWRSPPAVAACAAGTVAGDKTVERQTRGVPISLKGRVCAIS